MSALSDHRLRLLERLTDLVVGLDAQGAVATTGESVERHLGCSRSRLAGTSFADLVHPDDRSEWATALAKVCDIEDGDHRVELRLGTADGGWRWFECTVLNLLADPGVGIVVVVGRDITDTRSADTMRRARDLMTALAFNSTDVLMIVDAEGLVSWVSPSVRQVFGYEPDDLLGRSGMEFVHPDDLAEAAERLAWIVGAPGRSQTTVWRARHADGSWRWVEAVNLNLLEDPTVQGIIANFRDVTDRRRAELALRDSEAMFRSVAESSPLGMYLADAEGRALYVNERWQQITGLTVEKAMGHGWVQMVHPDDLEWLLADVGLSAFNEEFDLTYRVVRPDGEVRWITVHTSPLRHLRDERVRTVGVLDDITDRVEAERDTQRLTDIFEATQDIITISDPDGRVLYFNRAARRFLDLPLVGPIELVYLSDVFAPWSVEQLSVEIEPRLRRDGIWSGELALLDPTGQEVPVSVQFLVHYDADGEVEFFSGVLRDISERKAFEHQLAHQASHDPLTGLPNRVMLLDQLAAALSRARRHGTSLAVLFLDLDHFKVVNDSLGHSLGDRLLMAIADRLKVALRPGDTIARFGGDEFVLLCEHLTGTDDATTIARRVEQALAGPFELEDAEIYVGVSIGIAFSGRDSNEPEALIRDADAAMYRAKEKGRARYEVFDAAMRSSAVDRLDIENALRRALERRQLRVHYQPIIDLAGGGIVGVEALLRWEHPDRGLLLPGEFIAIAEDTGLIVPIGTWVLTQACRQLQRWAVEHPGTQHLVATVNLSGRQLNHPRLVAEVEGVLVETGIDPGRIDLEITESVLMDDVEMSSDTLQRLKALGVRLVVDDFGTGYSSLSYLRQFPVDGLKVDRSFVDGLGTEPGDSAIAAAIITLAHTLGLNAIAEGVETGTQLAELRALGCNAAQGFYMARPLPPDALLGLILQGPTF